ncbi:hypothetical protein LEMLEM_LOCUS15195 [Lemmus lemmus]
MHSKKQEIHVLSTSCKETTAFFSVSLPAGRMSIWSCLTTDHMHKDSCHLK